ncbi:urea carboxylase [Paraglaciecola aquimarina]|uniref:Urea carboxylase n=1 Tax=Paraglaciecola aquimarina TaxID=1235557 RepID=A0ABU3SVC3_9ALTE|nr:urea carboxylase [Paraglaciecola aquimarina]MDU0353949.1 urea carboxylase [Paraglaciecola aquimarina]
MFKTVLIANRGAIACRIIRTLKKLGIKSVAVYAEADRESLHVRQADQAFSLGEGAASQTYLDQQKIIDIAKQSGADAIHPGYGFLSENADFCNELQNHGITFIGPRAQQMIDFGLKHQARDLAEQAGVPLVPGSGLLADLDEVTAFAEQVGYPVMLKSTAGGGGIGMQRCDNKSQLEKAFTNVKYLGAQNFSNDGVFLEKFVQRARHIEVQVVGNGAGQVVTLGERDCSSQRRNQKVVEETPAPNLSDDIRQQMYATAKQLMASIHYLNAGTVEYIFDQDSQQFYFLEVNTRLQVEHGITELCFDVDLVEWMLKIAYDDTMAKQASLPATDLSAIDNLVSHGHAIQARVYAENPAKQFQPSSGLLTQVVWPEQHVTNAETLRIDHWIEAGIEVSPFFDPMLAKVQVKGQSREQAIQQLDKALEQSKLYGIITNMDYVRDILQSELFTQGKIFTRSLDKIQAIFAGFEVLKPGTMTTIQDYPARTGYWNIGVPPSGPFDFYSFNLANRLLGNSQDAAGLEITIQGPSLLFHQASQVMVCGAEIDIKVDEQSYGMNQVIDIAAGQTLKIGSVKSAGSRAYLAISGGIQCPEYLGSKSTFTLGQFGGHCGRALRTGDFIQLIDNQANHISRPTHDNQALAAKIDNSWSLRVMSGPHGAPDFFTEQDIQTINQHEWEIHYNSSRTGIRLIGPKPEWARESGGEAGLHPSNIHDNAYAFGTVDFTGDMPVILGPDGPSLGGFVCPFTVISADLWKLGQFKAGDKVRFEVVDLAAAQQLEQAQNTQLQALTPQACDYQAVAVSSPILDRLITEDGEPDLVFRQAGDKFLLVEYGDLVLDLALRARVQALLTSVEAENIQGVLELTPGIRSLQVHFDNQSVAVDELIAKLKTLDMALGDTSQLEFASRIVHLPLSWDDEACQLAIDKYMQSVRKDAPWCPSNIDFIKRINGLTDIQQVQDIVFAASYLVLGLGDVYLGAPVATPLNPCHRLVTTKYNPARTWTAENSVGIGGAYMCVYGMEGPGGYQFVGRTAQMWNRYRQTDVFENPWLLRFFDQIRFYPVSHDELEQIRADFPIGKWQPKIEQTSISMPELALEWSKQQRDIDKFVEQRERAFEQEMNDWKASGQLVYQADDSMDGEQDELVLADGEFVIESTAAGSVWLIETEQDKSVAEGDSLIILESMKMEIGIASPEAAVVKKVLVEAGQQVQAGQALLVLSSNPTKD